jgi:two-component system response regulator MtrA
VLMLTARIGEDDLLLGLDRGADDYLTKPYRPRELLARIRTLLRRVDHTDNRDVLRVGPITIDLTRRAVTVEDRPVDCTRDEFAILSTLLQQPERVFTRAQLLEQTNGYGRDTTERTIDSHMSNLRRKIEPNPRRPVLLLTVYGVGYKVAAG